MQLIRTATQANECIVEHLKHNNPDRIVPKTGELVRLMEQSLGEDVGIQCYAYLNAGYLNHTNISQAALRHPLRRRFGR